MNQSVQFFASILHTHLLGTEIYVHHYRDEKELPMISKDANYDFNYQESRHLKKPVEFKPVRHFISESTESIPILEKNTCLHS